MLKGNIIFLTVAPSTLLVSEKPIIIRMPLKLWMMAEYSFMELEDMMIPTRMKRMI